MIFTGNLKNGGKGSRVGVDSVSNFIRNLVRQLASTVNQSASSNASLLLPSQLTCWLIKTMPMSLRSWVNLSKADSIAAVSVLPSTTKKFFCASAPAVTC